MRTEGDAIREIMDAGRFLQDRQLVVATDGNLSIRLPGDIILITPSGRSLGEMGPDDLCKIHLDGRVFPGNLLSPSSEVPMHLAAYRARSDIQAVVHAHPPYCIAFSLAGLTLAGCLLPETVLDLGNIRTAEYFAPSSDTGVQIVAKELAFGNAFVLDRHGSLTVGPTLREALFRLERMERAAQITSLAIGLGGKELKHLSRQEVEELLAIKRAKGEIPPEVPGCNDCGACLLPSAACIVPPPGAVSSL